MSQFLDIVRIRVTAGRGGRGCRSFYRAGRGHWRVPNGGDGGDGGDVLMAADKGLATLYDLAYRKHYCAESGAHGGSNMKQGGRGDDCTVLVPPGTIIRDTATGRLLRELLEPGERVKVARGGRGGRGNAQVAEARPGGEGEERSLELELKLIADVGLIGLPNAGKSSLIRCISRATPRVAAYPFTTTVPVLGVVSLPDSPVAFTACDIPGLIAGAHAGKGLGLTFLRHVERTNVLVYVIDMAGTEGRDPWSDYHTLQQEITCYGHGVAAKPRVIAANKMDLPEARTYLKTFRAAMPDPIVPVSGLTGAGVPELIQAIWHCLPATSNQQPATRANQR